MNIKRKEPETEIDETQGNAKRQKTTDPEAAKREVLGVRDIVCSVLGPFLYTINAVRLARTCKRLHLLIDRSPIVFADLFRVENVYHIPLPGTKGSEAFFAKISPRLCSLMLRFGTIPHDLSKGLEAKDYDHREIHTRLITAAISRICPVVQHLQLSDCTPGCGYLDLDYRQLRLRTKELCLDTGVTVRNVNDDKKLTDVTVHWCDMSLWNHRALLWSEAIRSVRIIIGYDNKKGTPPTDELQWNACCHCPPGATADHGAFECILAAANPFQQVTSLELAYGMPMKEETDQKRLRPWMLHALFPNVTKVIIDMVRPGRSKAWMDEDINYWRTEGREKTVGLNLNYYKFLSC